MCQPHVREVWIEAANHVTLTFMTVAQLLQLSTHCMEQFWYTANMKIMNYLSNHLFLNSIKCLCYQGMIPVILE